jgi:hypothetical protein
LGARLNRLVWPAVIACVIGCQLGTACRAYNPSLLDDAIASEPSSSRATQAAKDLVVLTLDEEDRLWRRRERAQPWIQRRDPMPEVAQAGSGASAQGPDQAPPDAGQPLEDDAGAARDGSAPAADGGRERPAPRRDRACGDRPGYISEQTGQCYYALMGEQAWYVARDACERAGGHLVTIGDAAEQAFVARLVEREDVWIGLSRLGTSEFSWVTDEPLSYTSWEPEAPRARDESAVLLRAASGLWYDAPPGTRAPALCERR